MQTACNDPSCDYFLCFSDLQSSLAQTHPRLFQKFLRHTYNTQQMPVKCICPALTEASAEVQCMVVDLRQ